MLNRSKKYLDVIIAGVVGTIAAVIFAIDAASAVSIQTVWWIDGSRCQLLMGWEKDAFSFVLLAVMMLASAYCLWKFFTRLHAFPLNKRVWMQTLPIIYTLVLFTLLVISSSFDIAFPISELLICVILLLLPTFWAYSFIKWESQTLADDQQADQVKGSLGGVLQLLCAIGPPTLALVLALLLTPNVSNSCPGL